MATVLPPRPQKFNELKDWAEQATQLDPLECRAMLAQLDLASAARPQPEKTR